MSAAPTSSGTCCAEKKVGDILYMLVEGDKEDKTKAFGCKDGCVYKADEDPIDRFCFKDGVLPVTCLDDGTAEHIVLLVFTFSMFRKGSRLPLVLRG